MEDHPEISILIAVKNEERNIEQCLKRVFTTCPEAEVLVVDGGNDSTSERVAELMHSYPRLRYWKNVGDRGKGHATREGIPKLRGAILAQVDADMQFPPEQLPLLLDPIREGVADVTLGSRFMVGSERRHGSQNVRRAFGNFVVSGLASLLFGHRMTDVMAGFKAWRREVTQAFSLTSDHYSYEVELAVKAVSQGYRVVDIPIATEPRTAGTSSVRVFRDGVKTITDILRFRIFQH
ncbi:MAG: glycosyltransferase family 2 protein [Bdellovibrionota bacterium]